VEGWPRLSDDSLAGTMSEAADKLLKHAEQAQREKRLGEARSDLLAAIVELSAENAGQPLAMALRTLGELERKLGDGERARTHYEESVAILRNCGDALRLAHTVRHLGDVHHDAGRSDLARPCYEEAIALYRGHGKAPALDLANAIRSLAVLEQESGNRDGARRLWSEARELYAGVNAKAGVAECDKRLAEMASFKRP
jgi:tetratricopeptide (TPR) repeat protein